MEKQISTINKQIENFISIRKCISFTNYFNISKQNDKNIVQGLLIMKSTFTKLKKIIAFRIWKTGTHFFGLIQKI